MKPSIDKKTSGQPRAAPAPKLGPEDEALRPSDAAFARWLGASSRESVNVDIFKTALWRVDLFAESQIFTRARIDLDRNGKWDEEWVLCDSVVRRQTAPDANGEDSKTFVLANGKWKSVTSARNA